MRLTDTNILIYAADTSPEEKHKRARAAEVVKEGELCQSVQVFQEFYHQATRPIAGPSENRTAGLSDSTVQY